MNKLSCVEPCRSLMAVGLLHRASRCYSKPRHALYWQAIDFLNIHPFQRGIPSFSMAQHPTILGTVTGKVGDRAAQ